MRPATAQSGSPALRLFRNTGQGFHERSRATGIDFEGNVVDVAAGDYDGDGITDLLVLRWRRPLLLYRGRDDGTFTDATAQAGFSGVGGDGFSAIFVDYDQDQHLDLLVTSHAPYELALLSVLDPKIELDQHTPRLFRNTGEGRFEEVASQVGLTQAFGTMEAIAADFNGNGWPDLLLANGGLQCHRLEPSVLLVNHGGERFSLEHYLSVRGFPSNTVGAAVADINQNGKMEVLLGTGLLREFRARLLD